MLHLSETAEFLGTALGVTQVVAPWLPLVGVIGGGIILGLFNAHNRRRGNVETRAPDVNELWTQQAMQAHELDKEYRWRRRIQNFADELLRVFRGYVNRVQSGGSTDLTPHEQTFYESDTPTSEINVKSP